MWRTGWWWTTPVLMIAGLGACREPRVDAELREASDFRDVVQPFLLQRCGACHSEARAEGGYRVDGYLQVIGCNSDDQPITVPGEAGEARLLAALRDETHRALLSAEETQLLQRWLALGAPGHAGVHDAHFLDPRSPRSHGAVLRAQRYRPLLDGSDADACGACHEGAPGRAPSALAAAGAPACTSCHSQPEGVFACSTCHGDGARAHPPRSRCFFPSAGDSHAAHVEPSPSAPSGIACASCHPVPAGSGDFLGAHGDGTVEVWFAPLWRRAQYDAASKQCSGTCHAGSESVQPAPTWGGAALGCGSCHGAPPAGHYQGRCDNCHAEANADGSALRAGALHLNGKVEIGDGSGGCGSCHGTADAPWPDSGAHRAHAAPQNAAPVPCETCHEVPNDLRAHPRGGAARVRFAGLARRSQHNPVYDAQEQSCSATYCHNGRGGSAPAPRWNDTGLASDCGSCHKSPPPLPHSQASRCDNSGCHAGSVEPNSATLSPQGVLRHVDGRIDR